MSWFRHKPKKVKEPHKQVPYTSSPMSQKHMADIKEMVRSKEEKTPKHN